MIPEAKKSAVARALNETFGVSEPEEIRVLSASSFTSALVFRIVVRERPYLLRLITRTDVNTDPTRQFLCMKIAAEAGLSPRVRYTNVEDRVSIIDFVEARPLPVAEAVIPVAATLKAMHELPPFPKLKNDFDTAPTFLLRSSPLRDGFIQRFQAAKLLPEGEAAELFKLYERVRSVYPFSDTDLVSSHNDLKPPNMVFDGQHLWLIDWEAAFLNDRYNDLAVMANFVVASDADEDLYLRSYFGEATGEYRTARFYLMRQLVHMFYAMVYTQIGSAGKPVDADAPVPDFRGFHKRIWAGEVTLDSPESKVQFGRVHLRQLLQNARTDRFQDAIRAATENSQGATVS
ncbi:MAG TPA: phosphotransferase [Candidatus Acidoferrales bacterium]|nr:phosphotransferase [Candidatus Acidoferrales bacterium]